MEIRKIKNYEDYSIREDGKVISYKRNPAGQELKCTPNNAGYRTVTLKNDKGVKTITVNRLVITTFEDKVLPPLDEQLQIDHKDENKLNNHYSNLRWCTGKQNVKYYYENNPPKGTSYVPVNPVIKQQNLQKRSVEASIRLGKKLGTSIIVDGKIYDAVRQAARYILESEQKIGNIKNIETIRKELKKFTQGKRQAWKMYGRYSIGS